MSIGITEKQVSYDNPCAPIVKFSHSNNIDDFDDDDGDMMDDQTTSSNTPIEPTIGHSFKALSLEDLVKSFDNTIHACFPEQQLDISEEEEDESINKSKTDLITTSNTWSELIENLRTSLRNDLKLPHISQNCQIAMNSICEKISSQDEIQSIDDLNEDEEEELREQLDMHSVIVSSNNFLHEPFLTAEQVISEIDFMLQDMTPDSGYCDDILDLHTSRINNNNEFQLKNQSIYNLNELYEELNTSIKDLSSILVQELALRDDLEDEKESKNTFISLVLSIQNKRRHYQNEKRQKRRSLFGNSNYIEPGTYLTTVIPFDPKHPSYLSVEHLQNLNKILQAINEDSPQVPELLTNYILKVLCPC
ncbi:unnamed protein product [Adineta steineri]|uniref:Fasciculation and elongation protein zeta-2-like protein n=1 Tax=Adineta steineri TaxID=433720 RepID=A0A814XQT8_9BILA|nr:unnamed protein product [Adineta steineri]CAF1312003.1 unnamed protein product [Adineta steineri]CAF3678827.1 unnamed protein product [Adineta steineri]CAF3771660.1 unnamed protein product [Adineta steineri]